MKVNKQFLPTGFITGLLVVALLTAVSCNRDYEEWGQRKADSAFVLLKYQGDFEGLKTLLKRFAEDHEMEFFDETIHHPEHGALVNMQIGVTSSVLIWVANGTIDPRIIVLVFADSSNPNSWRPYEADLKRRLRDQFGALEDITEGPSEEA